MKDLTASNHRFWTRVALPPAALALGLAACTGASDSRSDLGADAGADATEPDATPPDGGAPDGDTPPDGGFGPIDGLDEGGSGRRIGTEHWIVGQELVSSGDGSAWLLWRSYVDPSFSAESVNLDHFDENGVVVRSSELAAQNPDGLLLHAGGEVEVYRNRCGALQADTCFYREAPDGSVSTRVWPGTEHTAERHLIDAAGNLVGARQEVFADRYASSMVAGGGGTYAVTRHGPLVLYRLDAEGAPSWSAEIVPSVVPPEVPADAPIEELLRSAELALQFPTDPVAIDGGVVIAATVARGTLAAVNQVRGVELALPADPRCPDVLVAHFSQAGTARYFSVPTPECEQLPKLTVAGGRAVVGSVLRVAKTPESNDTHQYDIGLAIVDLASGAATSRTIAFEEDDIVQALAPCGDRVCLAGMTGARSVDTGSTVTMGDGFVLPVSLDGAPESRWNLTSPRHSEIQQLVTRRGGLLFFASVNAPITHTADGDPWLGFNEGLLGKIDGI